MQPRLVSIYFSLEVMTFISTENRNQMRAIFYCGVYASKLSKNLLNEPTVGAKCEQVDRQAFESPSEIPSAKSMQSGWEWERE